MLEADKVRPEIRCYLGTLRDFGLWSEKTFLDSLKPLSEDSGSLWKSRFLPSPLLGWCSGAMGWVWWLTQIHPLWWPRSLEVCTQDISCRMFVDFSGSHWAAGAHLCLEIFLSCSFSRCVRLCRGTGLTWASPEQCFGSWTIQVREPRYVYTLVRPQGTA